MIDSILTRLVAEGPESGPKYQHLRDVLVSTIVSGDWPPGARLPTESELARVLPFSLGTVQKAFGELVSDGLVVRTRGRGSFVAPPHRRMAEPWHCRFLGETGTVLPVYPRLLGRERSLGRDWASSFGPDAAVAMIDRMLSIDDEFEVLSRFHAVGTVADTLLALPPAEVAGANFKLILYDQLGIRISRVSQTLLTAAVHERRRVGMGGPAHLLLEATAMSLDGDVVYLQELYIPRNRRRMLFESDMRES